MKTILYSVLVFMCANFVLAQEIIVGQKETLTTITVGQKSHQVWYNSNPEGFYSPKGPLVSQNGTLIFIPDTGSPELQLYKDGLFSDIAAPKDLPLGNMLVRQYASQQGITIDTSGYQLAANKNHIFHYYYYKETRRYFDQDYIAIVDKIPDNPESITDPFVYMNQMILIEGEFANKIQSVIKKLSVADYNQSNLTSERQIYSGLQYQNGGLSLNCDSWAIRRLR